ncbi:hypothetical protein [Paenibacillus alvei]|uniref:hypothetical protein n=1 Tax=Paenibacillus alvei TaxID=44250 RepID=UPI0013DD1E68|nr:hypothetical protein [Paenibacillus alvei]NEZ40243.1 hypothetical protein [Paenibacillus alvei]
MEGTQIAAKCVPLDMEDRITLLSEIKMTLDTGEANYYPLAGISYGCSLRDGQLIVTAGEEAEIPNASMYPFLIEHIGEPDEILVKESSLRAGFLIFYMFWNIESIPSFWFEKNEPIN